jgi:hypothetical protein
MRKQITLLWLYVDVGKLGCAHVVNIWLAKPKIVQIVPILKVLGARFGIGGLAGGLASLGE